MSKYESVSFLCEDGEERKFYILEQTTLNGFQYLLVEDTDQSENEDEALVYIMKGTPSASDEDEMTDYEMVEDEEELIAVSKVFEQLMEDTDFLME